MELPSLWIAIDKRLGEEEFLQERIALLEILDKVKNQAYLNMTTIQKWHNTYYDKKMESKMLITEDLVLLYDNRSQ